MKRKYGLRKITLFLSISVSVFSACICVLLMASEYYSARHKLDIYSKESQGWEACRQTEPTYFEANAEAEHENGSNSDDSDEVGKVKKAKGTLKMNEITSEDDAEDWEYEVAVKKLVFFYP